MPSTNKTSEFRPLPVRPGPTIAAAQQPGAVATSGNEAANPSTDNRDWGTQKATFTSKELKGQVKAEQLKQLINQRAARNQEALKKALQNAPESVKPALRQANQVADNGYQEALKHLDK